ncbi:MAG: hypothetical protein RMM17_08925 [Acidobacteriota bacterium]|nr:hypothetical protein [Blastocatellia bacterium]MDW8412789.1 hypothetical protein [Acidobacteriota bacterium]
MQEFRTAAIHPTECFREGWQLIKPDYWKFLGICFLGLIGGSIVPFGILLGPMLCGIYHCYLNKIAGKEVRIEQLMKGFEHFLPSFIATILQVILLALILVPLEMLSLFGVLAKLKSGQVPTLEELAVPVLTTAFIGSILAIATALVFIFAFPLIVDKNLSAIEAMKLSASAVFANLGGLLGLFGISILLGLIGILACYFGSLLVLPVIFAAQAIAYRKIFPQS